MLHAKPLVTSSVLPDGPSESGSVASLRASSSQLNRVIGIIIFCVATLQVMVLLVRPKKEHKHRIFWNIYHHSLGYSIIILGIVNIFKGFDILNPHKKWEQAYTRIIVAAILEAYTWF